MTETQVKMMNKGGICGVIHVGQSGVLMLVSLVVMVMVMLMVGWNQCVGHSADNGAFR